MTRVQHIGFDGEMHQGTRDPCGTGGGPPPSAGGGNRETCDQAREKMLADEAVSAQLARVEVLATRYACQALGSPPPLWAVALAERTLAEAEDLFSLFVRRSDPGARKSGARVESEEAFPYGREGST